MQQQQLVKSLSNLSTNSTITVNASTLSASAPTTHLVNSKTNTPQLNSKANKITVKNVVKYKK